MSSGLNLEGVPNVSPQSSRITRHRRNSSFGTATTAGATPRLERFSTDKSLRYEQPLWDKHCVLSLDGGGIRGYSSLIIMRAIMREVGKLEREALPPDKQKEHSSYDPEAYVPCIHKASSPSQRTPPSSPNTRNTESNHCGENCRYLPCHYFDYIGGTSTGGLTSIMLGRLRMSVEESIREYHNLAGEIFDHPRWASVRGPIPWPRDKYNGKTIQAAVDNVVKRHMSTAERSIGAGNFNSPPGSCRTVVFAYASRINQKLTEYGSSNRRDAVEGERPYLIRSYDHWGTIPRPVTERNPGVAHSITIWEAARATTAAPSYFDPIEISNRKFGDGGFGTNNPTAEMFWEVTHMNGNDAQKHGIELLLSIGTGEAKISRFANGVFAKYWAYINAAKKLASDSSTAHQAMEALKLHLNIPYYRFDVPEEYKLGNIKLDELKKANPLRNRPEGTLERIERVTEEYLGTAEVKEKVTEVASILVRQRQERSASDLWGVVASGRQYRCIIRGCRRCQELRARKGDLKYHLENEHKEHELGGKSVEEVIQLGVCPPDEQLQ